LSWADIRLAIYLPMAAHVVREEQVCAPMPGLFVEMDSC
jgi:hypothetical protein